VAQSEALLFHKIPLWPARAAEWKIPAEDVRRVRGVVDQAIEHVAASGLNRLPFRSLCRPHRAERQRGRVRDQAAVPFMKMAQATQALDLDVWG